MIRKTLAVLALAAAVSANAQEDTGETPPVSAPPAFANKSIDELSADEVLKLVRYSYTMYNRDFEGQLRLGIANKVPFILSLSPEAIRFIFNDPAQVILLDTKNQNFALYEGVGGKELGRVDSSKFDDQIRGTDVTYDDLSTRFLYWPNAKLVGQEKIKARECFVVRVLNPDGKGAYATVDVWIDKGSGGMLKMNGYDRRGRPIRRFEVLSGKKFDDVWMVDEMRIETIDPNNGNIKSATRMQIKSTVN